VDDCDLVAISATNTVAPTIRCKVFDLSSNGLYINHGYVPQIGEKMNLTFKLASHTYSCNAKVVRIVHDSEGRYASGFAMKFLNLPWRDKWKIKDFLGHLDQSKLR